MWHSQTAIVLILARFVHNHLMLQALTHLLFFVWTFLMAFRTSIGVSFFVDALVSVQVG